MKAFWTSFEGSSTIGQNLVPNLTTFYAIGIIFNGQILNRNLAVCVTLTKSNVNLIVGQHVVLSKQQEPPQLNRQGTRIYVDVIIYVRDSTYEVKCEHSYRNANQNGCGSFGRGVTSDARNPRFESSRRQFKLIIKLY